MIFVDMDGVLSDFDSKILEFYEKPVSEMTEPDWNVFWNQDCQEQELFLAAKSIHEGIDLVHMLLSAKIDICILTSTGGGLHHIDIARQKLWWLEKTFGPLSQLLPVAFCRNTKNKASFAKPVAILIDDRVKVCNAWERAGGIAFHFTTEISMEEWSKELLE